MNTFTKIFKLNEKKRLKHAVVYTVETSPGVAVVEAISSYIPIDQFKEIFNFIGELVVKEKITNLCLTNENSPSFISHPWSGILLNGKRKCSVTV